MLDSGALKGLCAYCTPPGRVCVCGDSHMRGDPVDITVREEPPVEPVEMKEYEYMVGHMPVTAMLTEKQAKRLKAKPVGEAKSPGEGNVVNNEAERGATQTREAEDAGVAATYADGTTGADAAAKARTARNKRAQ